MPQKICTCIGCYVEFKKKPNSRGRFCSLTCYRKSSRPNSKTGKVRKCKLCKKDIYVVKSAIRKNNFCSAYCHNTYQGRNKTRHRCKICGVQFWWSPSRSLFYNVTYCSIKCRNRCQDWKLNAVIAGNVKQSRRKLPNTLEQAGENLLKDLHLNFKTQVLIENKFCVDVRLKLNGCCTQKGIVIQWDGDYWHGHKIKIEDAEPRVRKRMNMDKSQDAYMTKCGYVILRFWEHEVKKQPEKVRETIRRTVQKFTR